MFSSLGLTGTWEKNKEGKGGGLHSHRTRCQTQSRDTGHIDERYRLAGGGCRRRPGGRRFTPLEDVGSR